MLTSSFDLVKLISVFVISFFITACGNTDNTDSNVNSSVYQTISGYAEDDPISKC